MVHIHRVFVNKIDIAAAQVIQCFCHINVAYMCASSKTAQIENFLNCTVNGRKALTFYKYYCVQALHSIFHIFSYLLCCHQIKCRDEREYFHMNLCDI